jgi:quinol monooxygenase YgiN
MLVAAQVTLKVCVGKDVGKAREALMTLQLQTRREAGCLRFDLFQWSADPSTFTLIEVFKDQSAFEQHLQTPYTQAYFALGMTEVANKQDVEVLADHVEG